MEKRKQKNRKKQGGNPGYHRLNLADKEKKGEKERGKGKRQRRREKRRQAV